MIPLARSPAEDPPAKIPPGQDPPRQRSPQGKIPPEKIPLDKIPPTYVYEIRGKKCNSENKKGIRSVSKLEKISYIRH